MLIPGIMTVVVMEAILLLVLVIGFAGVDDVTLLWVLLLLRFLCQVSARFGTCQCRCRYQWSTTKTDVYEYEGQGY